MKKIETVLNYVLRCIMFAILMLFAIMVVFSIMVLMAIEIILIPIHFIEWIITGKSYLGVLFGWVCDLFEKIEKEIQES